MDAQSLFRQGVTAIREEKDLAKGRDLLTKSLRLDPNNDVAWVWLSRTIADKQKQQQCLERALQLNPNNEQIKAMMGRLGDGNGTGKSANGTKAAIPLTIPVSEQQIPAPAKLADSPPPTANKAAGSQNAQIKVWLNKADTLLEAKDVEGAIEHWVRVLEVEPDHEVALANAVRHLSRLKYIDDARQLVWDALGAGTTHPSVYLTAIDIARYQGNHGEADDLRLKLATLPEADEDLLIGLADHFVKNGQQPQALAVLTSAADSHPKSQKILIRLADLTNDMGENQQALALYEKAASLGAHTKEGKDADQKLLAFAPSLTDKERGSTRLAIREAFGFGVVTLLMAWQDAGLDLLRLGINRWLGVLISVIGGYLIITATSSHQQQPLATWFGGVVPEPPEKPKNDFEAATLMPEHITQLPSLTLPVRLLFGVLGLGLFALSLWLVFHTAFGLVTNPNPTEFYVPSCLEIFEVPEIC
jgi:tetratricopeptide (TPR) repeat protein